MFRRAIVLIFLLATKTAFAQVDFSEGELNLRGTLMFTNLKNARLVVNSSTRAMKSFNLNSEELKKLLHNYKSGTKIEACIEIKNVVNQKNYTAELIKIRPLAPDEAVFIYGGKIKACLKNKGCRNFDKNITAPLVGDSVELNDVESDYFSCEK